MWTGAVARGPGIWFSSCFLLVRVVPLRPSSFLIFVFLGILLDRPLELLLRFRFLCTRPPDLHDPSGEYLGCGVQVIFDRGKGGIEPVGVVAVVSGPEGVNDCCT